MVETVGRRLQKARQARQWTIDEVAVATKIRPERIVDLEGDDLSHFPSLVYARSFLVKYAKHLGVDIQDDLEHIPVGNSVGLGEYNYLRATPAPRYQPEPRRRAEATRSRTPPVMLAILALLILIGVPTISFLAINLSRLSGGVSSADRAVSETQASPGAKENPTQVASANQPSNSQPPKEGGSSTPGTNLAIAVPSPSASASAMPSATTEGTVEVRRALPVVPDDQSAQANVPAGTTAVDTLEIRVRERTWLRVTKDRQNAEPIYNDFIGPHSPPIVIQGKRFWLRLPDKNALELRKNGQAVAGQDINIVIESGG